MPVFTIETPSGKRLKIEAPDQETAIKGAQDFEAGQAQVEPQPPPVAVDPKTMQPPGVPEFNPGVEGYDPQTGNVDTTNDRVGAFITGANNVPILGPAMKAGTSAISAGLVTPFSDKSFSQNYDQMRGRQEQVMADNPGTALLGNVAGSALLMRGIPGSPAASKAFGMTGSLPARMGFSALSNGAISGTDTAVRGGDARDVAGSAAIGAATGLALPVLSDVVSSGVGKVAGWFNKAPPKVGADELKAAAKSAYDRAEQAGVAFNGEGVNSLRSNIIKDLTDFGFDPANEPGVMPVIKRLQDMGTDAVTLKGLDTLRKVAANGFVPGNKSNNAAVSQIISRIDELVTKADPSMVMMGDAKAGSQALQEARKLWSSGAKLETVNGLLDRAGLNAGSSGSGGNVENATRQQLKRLLTTDSMKRGLTADEQAAIRKAVLGTKTQNVLRLAGKMSPTSGGLTAMIGGAGSVANPAIGIPAMVAGYGAKKTSEYLSRKSVGELVNLIAQGGDESTLPVIKNAVQLLAESKREALMKALTVLGVAGSQAVMSGAK